MKSTVVCPERSLLEGCWTQNRLFDIGVYWISVNGQPSRGSMESPVERVLGASCERGDDTYWTEKQR